MNRKENTATIYLIFTLDEASAGASELRAVLSQGELCTYYEFVCYSSGETLGKYKMFSFTKVFFKFVDNWITIVNKTPVLSGYIEGRVIDWVL